jgi:nucleoside-diphosphate-sugar epimerase
MSNLTNWKNLHGGAFENTLILVTGGAGFIGSHLATALTELGAKVTVLDDLSGGGNPAALPKDVQFVKGSILDQPLLQKCTDGRKFIFHQAALGSVPRSIEQPRLYHDVNSVGTLNVLEAARAAGTKRVMFAASSSAYGDSPTLPKVETMPPAPRSPYAATKAAGEALLAAYSASFPLDTASLRYFNIFGPRQSADNAYAAVIAAFAKSLLAGKHPTIFGDGEQSRDFTYIDNVVDLTLKACEAPGASGKVFNGGTGARITLNEVLKLLEKISGGSTKAKYDPPRTGDILHSQADIQQAGKILGYKPSVNFESGLQRTWDWYKQTYAKK